MLDENNKYPIDVIVAWAVSAKNAYAVTLEIAFFMIGVFQRLVVKPSFEKFVLMILLWFHILCKLVSLIGWWSHLYVIQAIGFD